MIVKTVCMLALFFTPLILLASGIVTALWMLFSLYILSGLGMAGIGMGVMHDAIHGSYSKPENEHLVRVFFQFNRRKRRCLEDTAQCITSYVYKYSACR